MTLTLRVGAADAAAGPHADAERLGSDARAGGGDIVAGGEQVAGVQADPESLGAANRRQDVAQVLEPIAQVAAHAGGVLEQHPGAGRRPFVAEPVQRGGDARDARCLA